MSSRHGPELGYSVVAGVIPCPRGWLIESAKLHGATFAPEKPRVVSSFTDVLDERPSFSTVAIHAPIGYLDEFRPGGRTCDAMARSLLGPRRGSTVHSAPLWESVNESGDGSSDHLDAITLELLPRFREVAKEMAPYLQRTIYEVHPELSFYRLNGDQPLRWSKKTHAGRIERFALLEKRIPGLSVVLGRHLDGVLQPHLLDAAALMWTGRLIQARAATRMPTDPEWDEQGLRMEMVF
jgi:predicted RNase H-like nuclease